jgi:glycosyltransferase involved in cell wall biosynthesis
LRAIALLTVYNEERFIAGCLEDLIQQGLEVVLLDNCSIDRTVSIAEAYLGRGLLRIEMLARSGVFSLRSVLRREEELAASLDAEWFMHVDADEIRRSPWAGVTLADAFAAVESEGFNAINFLEFTFIPTSEAPDHDHPDFQKTMLWYYPFLPVFPHRVNAWKRQPHRVDLQTFAGHHVTFPGLRLYPESFRMRHYLVLSAEHAIRKYADRQYDSDEVRAGWHGWRGRFRRDNIVFPSQRDLRTYASDEELDAGNPRKTHYLMELLGSSRV